MSTEELLNLIDKHDADCEFERLRAQGRTGDLYAEVEKLYNEAAVQRAIMKNKLTALCAKYGKDKVEWMHSVVVEDKKYGVGCGGRVC